MLPEGHTMPPWTSVILKANIPVCSGMVFVDGTQAPDLTDRATFLLCVDEVERRNSEARIPCKHGSISPLSARMYRRWTDDDLRETMIVGVAKVLSELV